VNAVASALTVFDAIVENGTISLDRAASLSSVSRSTAYRLVMTLTEAGLVDRAPEGGYRPGPRAYQWASRLVNQLDINAVAAPVLRRLWSETGESVNLALLHDTKLVYVDAIESPGLLRTVEEMGTSAPIHAAAIGKAVTAHLDPPLLARALPPEPYPRLGPRSATTWQELQIELDAVRHRGYALDVEEVSEGVACVAAPVMLDRRVIGAISLSGPRTRMTDERLAVLGEKVRSSAEAISGLLSPSGGS
jgi:IclR family acetate operon transcriptional repressor